MPKIKPVMSEIEQQAIKDANAAFNKHKHRISVVPKAKRKVKK